MSINLIWDDLPKLGWPGAINWLVRAAHSLLEKVGLMWLAHEMVAHLAVKINEAELEEIPPHASQHRGEIWIISRDELPGYLSQGWIKGDMEAGAGGHVVCEVISPR